MGLLGVTVPERWGGLGLGYLEHTIAMEGKRLIRSRGSSYAETYDRNQSSISQCGSQLRGGQYKVSLIDRQLIPMLRHIQTS